MFSDEVQIELGLSIISLVSGITALQKAMLMMQNSNPSSLVRVSVLMCFPNFELQSESSANRFHISGKLLVYMKLVNFKMHSFCCLCIF